jgi:hypothetical protein
MPWSDPPAPGLPRSRAPPAGRASRRQNDLVRPSRDDSWPRVLRNTAREYIRLQPQRRRLGDPKGLSANAALAWFIGGPIFLIGGAQAIWADPSDPRGLGIAALGLTLVVAALRYLLRPATIERDPPRRRAAKGPRPGRDADDV